LGGSSQRGRFGLGALGDRVAAPATFIIGREREILWSQIGENIADRSSTPKTLGELGRLFG
jgi:hypothetical protein